jgi:hypothetical protein
MFRIIPLTPFHTHTYHKWCIYFERYTRHLYQKFIDVLNHHRILYYDYSYENFCRFMYKNSSKRIPTY